MSTISKPVMVQQEPTFIYRIPVRSEVLVSPSGPLQGISRGTDQSCLPQVLLDGECDTNSHQVPYPDLLIGQEMNLRGWR